MCASYSSRKYLIVLKTGLGALPPSAHREPSAIAWHMVFRSSTSSSLPFPAQMSSRISLILRIPSRQGTHLPQDSSLRKARKYLATSTIQERSSMTIMPPEPIMEPTSVSLSKSTGISSRLSGIQPPDGPPVCTALNLRPLVMPPPMS